MSRADADSPTLLVVEDDPGIRRAMELTLGGRGFRILTADRGEMALALMSRERVELVLLDIMLPGMSGLAVCQELRSLGHEIPIVLVSARGAEDDIIRGLDAGADDYVTKPFRTGELVARIMARLRRAPQAPVAFGDVHVDLATHQVTLKAEPVELSPTEFALLRLFLRRAGSVLTRDTILRAVWGDAYDGTDRTVDNFVTRLRQKLDTPGAPRFFHTVRGVGYRFEINPDEPG
jgi:two-component system alkaline phosphatase synthesis response regulator PhoP